MGTCYMLPLFPAISDGFIEVSVSGLYEYIKEITKRWFKRPTYSRIPAQILWDFSNTVKSISEPAVSYHAFNYSKQLNCKFIEAYF